VIFFYIGPRIFLNIKKVKIMIGIDELELEKDIRELQDLIDTYREEGFLVNEQLLADLEILRTRLEMAK